MNILIVTAMFPPIRTGTSFYSRNLAEALSRNGCKVELITTKNNEISSSTETLSFKVHRIPAWHIPINFFFKHLRFCSFIPSNYILVTKITKSFQPDIIVLINHYLDIAFPVIYASRKVNVPLYISVGTQLQSLNKFRDRILRFLDRLIVGNFIFPFAKRIISWDHEIERYINDVHKKSNANKSVIIPFGVNGDISAYNNYKNEYNDSNQILGVGAIIGHRNYLYQIRVFNELLKDFPGLKLKIIGNQYIDKPYRLANELGILDSVIFTGEIPHEEVLNEYKKSLFHWMMLNGEYVGLGTSTIESMLLGIPIVSNVPENLFGMNRLQNMGNYVFTDGNSINNDVERFSLIIRNRAMRQKIGQNGKEFVKEFLNWDKIAYQFNSYFFNDMPIESK